MAKMWSGRFRTESSALLDTFNASITFDKTLWREDIAGSMAHAKMLYNKKLLDKNELDALLGGLSCIKEAIEAGKITFDGDYEDVHMAIESIITECIGDVGKKLHTARSRNDQVALDFRMYILRHNITLRNALLSLMQVLLDVAKNHTKTIMPGFTHLQHAQPISLAFHLNAWACNLMRDVKRLSDDYKRNDSSPLGAGALAGTPYKNDRAFVADELGLGAVSLNAMDSVSDRDFALDMLYSLSMIMMHLSRIAEELILWSSQEFGFIALSDAYATGSSIMPNKKNPDIPELVRGKSGRVYGALIGLLTTMKALPFAYNKDMQEDKEGVFDAISQVSNCLEILNACIKTMTIKPQNMLKMAKLGHITATDLADYLVREKQVPFRDAHHIVGKVVAYAESKGKDLSDLSQSELLELDSRLDNIKVLSLEASMEARDSIGGTATKAVESQIKSLQDFIDCAKKALESAPKWEQILSKNVVKKSKK